MYDIEKEYYLKGYELIAGSDEAGRGPLCGPVVCAAVIFPLHYQNKKIKDSKMMSDKERREAYKEIIKDALSYSIIEISPATIDKINIYQASKLGMKKALLNLSIKPDLIITDYMKLDEFKEFNDILVLPLAKGDQKSINVAAASILAKVTRDDIMEKYDKLYPYYNFKSHKGYPTKEHLEIIKEKGIIKGFYRETYKPVKELLVEQIKLF